MAGLEPAVLCSQNTWVGRYPTSRYALLVLRSKLSTDPCGNRTRLPGLKGRCPVPIDERAVCSVRTFHARRHRRALFTQWVGRCSNPRLRLFRPPLRHLSYRPNEKSPMSCDTGLRVSSGNWRPGVTSAMDTGGAYWPAVGRQSAPYRIVRVIYSTKNTFLTRSLVVVAFAGTTRISARGPVLFH